MLKAIKNSIPNTITSLSLICGALACIFSFHYNEEIGCMLGYEWAMLCIGIGAIFDFCDGAAARMLHAYSDMGKELDSLADLISFGLAPAMLVFNTIAIHNSDPLSPWAFAALFIPAMGALRLAKFNIDTRQTTTFIGLPIPANAIFWIGLVSWINTADFYPGNWIIAVAIIAVSLVMVSNISMFSLKFKNFKVKENALRFLIIIAAIALTCIFGLAGLMWTILLYVLLSIVAPKK